VPPLPTSSLSRWRKQRGFTLIELMVVVVIIAILAVIAVPLFAARFQEQRVRQNAQRIAEIYRGARARALGRGAAILVQKTGGTIRVLEGVQGSSGSTLAETTNCGNLPTRGCITNNWGNVGSGSTIGTARELSSFSLTDGLSSTTTFGGAAPDTLNICFSPAGLTWVNTGTTWSSLNWAPMQGAASISVTKTGNLKYDVIVLPNGSARLGK